MWFLFALLSAVGYSALWVALYVSKKIPVTIVQIFLSLAGPLLILRFHPTMQLWTEPIWIVFIVWMFFINPIFSWLFTFAVQRTDLTISKPLASVSSVTAMVVAWAAFGESLPAIGILGILIGAGGMWALYHTRKHAWKKPYPWIVLACVCSFGINTVLTREALTLYPDPFVITGIGYTASFLWWIMLALGKHLTWRPKGNDIWLLLFITVAAAMQDVAATFALALAPAAYVISIKRLSILLTSVIGYTYFKERELTLTRLIVATCVVIAGAILLVY
jgi:drug/metabolite transporter (DMT)-like permease